MLVTKHARKTRTHSEEMVQTTKCLPCKPEVVSSIPKTHMKGEKNVHGGLVLGKHTDGFLGLVDHLS